jgi:hypothetical protein
MGEANKDEAVDGKTETAALEQSAGGESGQEENIGGKAEAREKGKLTPASQASQAMLSMLRSFVAQDMVEKRAPRTGEEGKGNPHRSPLGVPLSRKKSKAASAAASNATDRDPSPATPMSPAGEGIQTPPMTNPFSAPTSPVMASGFYGYGWPPYHPMQYAGQGQDATQDNSQGIPRGYMPPPFYPHPAMLQPWHPGQTPSSSRQAEESEGTSIGQGYLPPHLLAQLGALHQGRPQVEGQSGGRRGDTPVRISGSRRSSRRSSRREWEAPDERDQGKVARSEPPAPTVPPKDAADESVRVGKPDTDKQWTKIFICLATSLGA